MASTHARAFNSYDALKLLALITMTLDHAGDFLFPELPFLRAIGRMAAPIFCFLVGWNGRYAFRWPLLIAALLATATDVAHQGTVFELNILWTILFGRMLLQLLATRAATCPLWAVLLLAAVWAPLAPLVTDYGSLAFVWMLWGREQRLRPNALASVMLAVISGVGTLAYFGFYMHFGMRMLLAALPFVAVTIVLLQRFELRPLPQIRSRFLAAWSRHALAYYVVHRALLIGIAMQLA